MKKAIMCFAMIGFLCVGSYAKKMTIMNFNQGELPNNNNCTDVSISEENADKIGGFTAKAVFEGTEGGKVPWVAVMRPSKASWSGYTTVNIEVFNPSDRNVKFIWMIKGAKTTDGPDNRRDWDVVFPPGKSRQSIKIDGAKCNDGKSPLDLSCVYIWAFGAKEEKPVTLFFQKLFITDEEVQK